MREILKWIEDALGADGVVKTLFDGEEPLDLKPQFCSVARDFSRRNPPEPQYAARPSSGAFRISELPAPPA